MAKIEELSELLIHELDHFSASIENLEKLNKDGVKVDLSDLKGELRVHRLKTDRIQEHMVLKMENLEHALEKSKVYPDWTLAIVVGSLLLNFILILILVKQ